jgi:hypothetical protein
LANVEYTLTDTSGLVGGIRLSDDDTVVAYQLILGAERPISDCLSIFGQYKLLGITEQEYGVILPINGDSFITHNLVFGAKVGF